MPNPTPNPTQHLTGTRCLDCAAVLYTDPACGDLVDGWGERICSASYRPHVANVPYVPVRAAGSAPATQNMAGPPWRAGCRWLPDRLRRAQHGWGRGGTRHFTPRKAVCARSLPNGSAGKRYAGKHLAVRLDAGPEAPGTGKAASSGVLMVGSAVFGGEFCEPDDPRRAVLDFGSAIRARGLAGSSRWRWLPRRAR